MTSFDMYKQITFLESSVLASASIFLLFLANKWFVIWLVMFCIWREKIISIRLVGGIFDPFTGYLLKLRTSPIFLRHISYPMHSDP